MKLRKPSYYDEFHCIGSACSDTCCANWEIEVDEESAARYTALGGTLGERMKQHLIVEENEAYFAMDENRRCPFLNQENLCDLILECGEDILCDICREHPRHYMNGLEIIRRLDWDCAARRQGGCCCHRRSH